jgi:multidrug resistance efflux pump
MESLPKIPSPPAHRWREFRIRVMPVVVFFAALCTVVVLWKDHLAAPTVMGEVEVVKADIKSEKVGTLANLSVTRFQMVTNGQILAKLITADDEALTASLDVIEADLKLMRARMSQDQVRNDLNYELLRMEPLKEQVLLATTRVKLREAESEYQRVLKLYQDKIVSEALYDAAKNLKDALQAEVQTREDLVANLKQAVQDNRFVIGSAGGTASGHSPNAADKDVVEAAIAAQEAKLRLAREPVLLRATMDGIVSYVYHRDGERILPGDPVVTVTSTRPQHVVGYLRQPRPFDPTPGTPVIIRTRGPVRQEVVSFIVSPAVESPIEMQRLTSPLRMRGFDNSMERGLPFLVAVPSVLPADMRLHPGELVDLIVRRTTQD